MKKSVFVFLMLLPAVCLFAQDDEDEQTIEELYLKNSIQTAIIKAEAESNDRDMKMIAIQDLEAMIEDGGVSEDDEAVLGILFDLGQEGVTRQVREQGHVINDFPMVRMEAARLLGEVGGEIARDHLITILFNDPESMVLSEAVMAIAKCGLDDPGAQRAIAASMYRQTATGKDNNFAVAYLNAVQMAYDNGEEITDPFVYEEIVKIIDPSNGYKTLVRDRALNLLRQIQEDE